MILGVPQNSYTWMGVCVRLGTRVIVLVLFLGSKPENGVALEPLGG